MEIGELNRRVNIQSYTETKTDGGGIQSAVDATYSIWAKVEDRSGSLYQQGQEQWNYDYKITFRYEKSRVITTLQTILYAGKTLRINSISYFNEGKLKYAIARCSTVTI